MLPAARINISFASKVVPVAPGFSRSLLIKKPQLVCQSTHTVQQTEAATAAQRREIENEARRRAYDAQREAEIAAEKSGLQWWEVDCPINMVNVQSLAELQTVVEGECAAGKLVVVNFFAPECYACKTMQPKLRQIARGNPDVVFVKVNGLIGDLMQYCEDMGITTIPFFHFYKHNKRVAAFSANMRPEKLRLLRAEIAAHKEQPMAQADTAQYQTLEA